MEKILDRWASKKPHGGAFPERMVADEPAIVVTDAHGRVISVNAAFEAAVGYSRYEVIGRNVLELKNGIRDPQLYQAIWSLISRGESAMGPWVSTDAASDGRKTLVTPLCDPLGSISNYMAIRNGVAPFPPRHGDAEDPYHRVRITRLAAGIAHTLNNLLTVILGRAHHLMAHPGNDASHRREIEEIRAAGEKAAGVVRRLLAFGRVQVLEPGRVDLPMVVRRALDGISARIGPEIKLRKELDPDTGWVRIDPEQIEWIVDALLENACGNMPAGGRLSVATANVDVEKSVVRQHVPVRRGRYVMLSIHDTGGAAGNETGPRVFEPFLDTLEDPPGLSLAAVYGAVRQSNGHIWVFSSPGKGTTFKIYFPREEGS